MPETFPDLGIHLHTVLTFQTYQYCFSLTLTIYANILLSGRLHLFKKKRERRKQNVILACAWSNVRLDYLDYTWNVNFHLFLLYRYKWRCIFYSLWPKNMNKYTRSSWTCKIGLPLQMQQTMLPSQLANIICFYIHLQVNVCSMSEAFLIIP